MDGHCTKKALKQWHWAAHTLALERIDDNQAHKHHIFTVKFNAMLGWRKHVRASRLVGALLLVRQERLRVEG